MIFIHWNLLERKVYLNVKIFFKYLPYPLNFGEKDYLSFRIFHFERCIVILGYFYTICRTQIQIFFSLLKELPLFIELLRQLFYRVSFFLWNLKLFSWNFCLLSYRDIHLKQCFLAFYWPRPTEAWYWRACLCQKIVYCIVLWMYLHCVNY